MHILIVKPINFTDKNYKITNKINNEESIEISQVNINYLKDRKDKIAMLLPFRLTAGPRNKSKEIREFEDIIKDLLSDHPPQIEVDTSTNEMMLIYPLHPHKNINLSVLLARVDFSHMACSDSDIAKYESYLRKHGANPGYFRDQAGIPIPQPFSSLPRGLVDALMIYTQSKAINALLNGGPKKLIKERDFMKILLRFDSCPRHYLRYLILSAAFAAVALNRLPVIYSQQLWAIADKLIGKNFIKHIDEISEEKTTQAQQSQVISEEEANFIREYIAIKNLKRADDMEWMRFQRSPMLSQQVSFTSMTYAQKYVKKVQFKNNTSYVPSLERISVHRGEGEDEVLISGGTQIIYYTPGRIVRLSDGTPIIQYEAELVNSLEMPRRLSRSIALVLRDAHREFFVKRYTEMLHGEIIDINGVQDIVPRANHNTINATRKLFYLESVINYFKKYAADVQLRRFCENLAFEDLEDISWALIYSVTGRESEISYKDDPVRYQRYKEQSAENFVRYAKRHGKSPAFCDRWARLILYMCQPNFVTDVNIPDSQNYRLEDNYLYHIMAFVHKLDFPRCKAAEEFQQEIEIYITAPFISEDPAQRSDLSNLLQYAFDCITVTGDRYFCQMEWGAIKNDFSSYQEEFVRASREPAFCEAVLQQVPTPELQTPKINAVPKIGDNKMTLFHPMRREVSAETTKFLPQLSEFDITSYSAGIRLER